MVAENGEIRYVTAQDFIYGLRRIIVDEETDYGYMFYAFLDPNSFDDQVEIIDDITFRITLNSAAGHFDVLMDLYSSVYKLGKRVV